MPIHALNPELGLNGILPDTLIDPREAGKRTQNIIYERGLLRTPDGFAKVDLTTTGLNSGDSVLNLFPYNELDRSAHFMAVTKQKIFENDLVNNEWDDKTQTGLTMSGSNDVPVAYIAHGHSDTAVFLDNNSAKVNPFYHLFVTNGVDNIQRWAGKQESTFLNLLGGGDYHDGTTHRAAHVGSTRSRLILLSPQNFSSSSNRWTAKTQQVRWPQVGKIETWTGTGSGSVSLTETGGTNLWAGPLAGTYIIWQTRGIWDLNWVGGTTVFDPRPMLPDLGLLAAHLLVFKNSVAYFVGDDFNVYSYLGGTVHNRIGDKIHRFLEEEMSPTNAGRSWMSFDVKNKRFWIFITANGDSFIRKAFGYDITDGSWSVKDFNDLYSTTSGITTVSLVAAQTFTTGDSYDAALLKLSPYQSDVSNVSTVGDVTEKYGDVLRGDTTANVTDFSDLADAGDDIDFTDFDFSKVAAGLEFDYSSSSDNTNILAENTTEFSDWSTYSGKILRIDEGSNTTGMPHGTHYYQLTDVCAVNNAGDWSMTVHIAPRDGSNYGAAVNSGTTVEELNAVGGASDTTATLFDPSGETYNDKITQERVAERMVIGDDSGFVYAFDPTYTTYDTARIISRHTTQVIDFELPDKYKRWDHISVVAKAKNSGNGNLNIRVRYDNFDTSDTGWIDNTFTLTDDFEEYRVFDKQSSKHIQYEFDDVSGDFEIAEYKIFDPLVGDDR